MTFYTFKRSAVLATSIAILAISLIAASAAQATVSISSISTGVINLQPNTLVLTTDYIYTSNTIPVGNPSPASVSRVDRATNVITTLTIPGGTNGATSLVLGGTQLYAATDNGRIARIDTTNFTLDPTVLNTGGNSMSSIAYSNAKLFAASYGGQKLFTCDIASWPGSCSSVPMSQSNPYNGSAYGPYGPRKLQVSGTTLVISSGAGGFWFYDLTTNQVASSLLLSGAFPDIQDFDIHDGKIFLTDYNNSISRIDIASGLVEATTALDFVPYSITYGGGYLYVTKFNSDTLYQVDASSLAIVMSWPLTANARPRGLAFDTGTLYTGTMYNGGVSQISVFTGLPMPAAPTSTPTPTAVVSPAPGLAVESAGTLASTGFSAAPTIIALLSLVIGLLLLLTRRKLK